MSGHSSTSSHPSTSSIVILGDLHSQWRLEDRTYLEQGDQEMVLFVGDLGDEDPEIVRSIKSVRAPKAVILGNHDAWQSFSHKAPTNNLHRSVEILGDDHLAYSVRECPRAGISLVGARPFSWGGADIRSPEVYDDFFGITSMGESASAIVKAAYRAEHDDIVIVAHNGPTGLGEEPYSIFGKDFGRRPRGDFGDIDLMWAIERLRKSGKRVRAVIAGHMHDKLSHPRGGLRTRFVRQNGIDYINTAVVPRLRKLRDGTFVRHYVETEWEDGELVHTEEIWVDNTGEVRESSVPDFEELPLESTSS